MSDQNEEYELFASCLAGVESLLAEELKTLGALRVRPLPAGVSFYGDVITAYRVCLWSRLASRVTLMVARFPSRDSNELYENAMMVPWSQVIARGATIAVTAFGTNENLHNTQFTALRLKDAICDSLRKERGLRPKVDTANPDASFDIRLRDNKATVSLDLSGGSLYKRPYLFDDDSSDASVMCARAAALLSRMGWNASSAANAVLLDPVCGSGELLAEAASLATDRAPGLGRRNWGFRGWIKHDAAVWQTLTREADERFQAGLLQAAAGELISEARASVKGFDTARIAGCAASSPRISRARRRVRKAGLSSIVSIVSSEADLPVACRPGASRAASLPFVEEPLQLENARKAGAEDERRTCELEARLPEVAEVVEALKAPEASKTPEASDKAAQVEGEQVVREQLDGSHALHERGSLACVVASILSSAADPADARRQTEAAAFTSACFDLSARYGLDSCLFGLVSSCGVRERFGIDPAWETTLGAGRVETDAVVFDRPPAQMFTISIPDLASGAERPVQVLMEGSGQFAARLRKVFKERRKWARDEGATCYRVYDADLPEYSCAIDVYEGEGRAQGVRYVHVAEYAPPPEIDIVKANSRFFDILTVIPVVMDVRPDHVFSKVRRRSPGGKQYASDERRNYVTQVGEGGFLFEVDLAGYLDTGLFLDHRLTREMICSMAKGTRFLNLFAYTGAATVYAAGGGAIQTTTVDMSWTYLDWARRNMKLNGFDGSEHAYERADAVSWVREARRDARRFDLIFVDPPTFSNSKTLGKRTWDVQRDHAELLIGVSRLLSQDGQAVFSCNLRSFKPDYEKLERYGVEIEEISAQTIPHDFERNPRVHKCYLVRRVPQPKRELTSAYHEGYASERADA